MTKETYEIVREELNALKWSEYSHSFKLLLKEIAMRNNFTKEDLLDFKGFQKVEVMNKQEKGTLTGYDCPYCNNRGYNYYHEIYNGYLSYYAKDCICKKLRAEFDRLEKCGISRNLIETYKFETFIPKNKWQKDLKDFALKFLEVSEKEKKWFVVCGSSGAGKSHISTSIYLELLKKGKKVKFMAWRDLIDSLKLWKKSAYIENQKNYEKEMNELKTTEVLYIDDFLKLLPVSGFEREAELDLAYSIINSRYNNNLITIITTEELLDDLNYIDKAIASRIVEKSKEFCFQLKGDDKNQRYY